MRDEVVTHYHRPVAKLGETHGRDEELSVLPLRTEEPYIQQIIPASGYLVAYNFKGSPELWIEPVVAWGVVLHYEANGSVAEECRDVQALVLEDGVLKPVSDVERFEIVKEGDEKRIEELREEVRQRASRPAKPSAVPTAAQVPEEEVPEW